MEDSKFLEFWKKHSSKMIWGLCGLIILGVFLDRNLTSKKSERTADFATLLAVTKRCQAGEPLSVEGQTAVAAILERHPELHPTYDHLMALVLLAGEHEADAIAYTIAMQERLNSYAPKPALSYTNTTLLIAGKRYDEALTASLALESELQAQKGFEKLRAFNLWRIASLAQELHKEELRSATLMTLQASPAFPSLSALFQEKAFSLESYFNLKSI